MNFGRDWETCHSPKLVENKSIFRLCEYDSKYKILLDIELDFL